MRLVIEEMRQFVTEIENELDRVTNELDHAPEGSLNTGGSNDQPVFYRASMSGTDSGRRRKRVTLRDDTMIDMLVRKDHLKDLVKVRSGQLKIIHSAAEALARCTDDESLLQKRIKRYPALDPDRVKRACSTPICDIAGKDPLNFSYSQGGRSEAVHQFWENMPYEQSDYRPEGKRMRTGRGLMVRSKSELLIAELLYRYDVPFRYEQVLHVGSMIIVPDFTIKRSDGQIFYWEHMGRISDPVYFERQIQKVRIYHSAGIMPGRDLLVSYDGPDGTIDIRRAESMIKTEILQF